MKCSGLFWDFLKMLILSKRLTGDLNYVSLWNVFWFRHAWWCEVKKLSAGCTRNPESVCITIWVYLNLTAWRLSTASGGIWSGGAPPINTLGAKWHWIALAVWSVYEVLGQLNPGKAYGPDDIPNWFLNEYAKLLLTPITNILNCSFREQQLPCVWKVADVSTLPQKKPVKDLKNISGLFR